MTQPLQDWFTPEYRDHWRDKLPELWRWVEPRRYQLPAGFPAVTNSIGHGFYSLFYPDLSKVLQLALADRSRFLIQYQLSHHGVPTYLVARELANALWRTKPPSELPLHRLHFPYPAMRLVFEEGSLPFRAGHLATVEYAILPAGTAAVPRDALGPHLEYLPRMRPTVKIASQLMVVASGFRMNGSLHASNRRTVYSDFTFGDCVSVGDLLAKVRVEPDFYSEGYSYLPPMTDLPPVTLGTLVNLILFMTAKPDHIEAETVERAERQKHNRIIDALYTPQKIGMKFRLAALERTEETEITGRKLAPGWRCGHWRDVAFGPHHSLRREQWIEPYPYGIDDQVADHGNQAQS